MKRLLFFLTSFLTSIGAFCNELPFFISQPVEVHIEFDFYSYQIVVSDTNLEDSLYFIVEEKPDWLVFSDLGNDTALLTGMASQYYESNPVLISVSDGTQT